MAPGKLIARPGTAGNKPPIHLKCE